MLMGTAFPPSPDRLSPVGGQASSGYVPERLHPPPSRSTLSCGTTPLGGSFLKPPPHYPDGCQHMSGVCSQLAVWTQQAQLLATRQESVQHQQGIVLCQEPLPKFGQHAGVEAGVIQLQ